MARSRAGSRTAASSKEHAARGSEHAPRGTEHAPASSRPKRSLGQNFLTDPNTARKIAALVRAEPGDTVLEIGPGRGALTRHLLQIGAGRLMAVEKDQDLARELKARWPEIEVVAADALEFPWENLGPCRIVGNLPYNVASPLLWEIVSRARAMVRLVAMVQKEVGQRLAAKPGSRDYGGLSVWVQSFARVEYAFTVPPTVFRPRPKVDSAVLAFIPLQKLDFSSQALAGLIKRCFSQRRKQLRNLLRDAWSPGVEDFLLSRGLSPESRPEVLGPEDFQALSFLLSTAFPA